MENRKAFGLRDVYHGSVPVVLAVQKALESNLSSSAPDPDLHTCLLYTLGPGSSSQRLKTLLIMAYQGVE